MPSGDSPTSLLARLTNPLRWLREEGTRAELARGTVAALVIRVVGIGVAFAVQILIARTLGLSDFGEYAYVMSWLLVLSMVATLGLDSASLRFLAAYRTSKDWELLRGFLRSSQAMVALAATAAAVVAAGVVALLAGDASVSLSRTAWIACLVLPLFALLNLQSAALRAFKRIAPAQFSLEILRPAILGLIVGALYLLGPERPSAPAAMLATLVAVAAAWVFTRFTLRRTLPRAAVGVQSSRETRTWIGVALPLLLMSGLYVILGQTDIIMVGAMLDTDSAGVYAAATRLAMLVPLCLFAVNTIAAPLIAELWTAERQEQLQKLLTVSARVVFVATLPLVVVLVLAGRFALGLFGDGFEQSYVPLMILAVGQLINVGSGAVGYVMTMTGLELKAARIMVIVTAANLALNAILIPLLGLRGAALATAASTVAWNLAMLQTIRHQRGLDSSFLGMR